MLFLYLKPAAEGSRSGVAFCGILYPFFGNFEKGADVYENCFTGEVEISAENDYGGNEK